jgi:hypothetical protein
LTTGREGNAFFSCLTNQRGINQAKPSTKGADEDDRYSIGSSRFDATGNHSQAPSQLHPTSEMKTLGLIGGTSWYSTVDYYRYINEAVNDAYGNRTNPPLILHSMNQEKIHELQARGQWNEIPALITETAGRLRAGGAQRILFCAKTHPQSLCSSGAKHRSANSSYWGCDGTCNTKQRPEEGRVNRNVVYDGRWVHGRLA